MLVKAQLQSASVVLQVAMGLEYLHSSIVRHGSLWPGNVTISPDGKRVKLADYGRTDRVLFAAFTSQLAYPPADTDKWRGAYTAPEIFKHVLMSKGKATAGGSTTRRFSTLPAGTLRGVEPDIYALGCILARMAQTAPLYAVGTATAGVPPWSGRPQLTSADKAHQVLTTALAAASDTMAPMGVSMMRLAAECIAIQPSDRPDVGTVLSHMRLVARQAALDEITGCDKVEQPEPASMISLRNEADETEHDPALVEAIEEASRLSAQEARASTAVAHEGAPSSPEERSRTRSNKARAEEHGRFVRRVQSVVTNDTAESEATIQTFVNMGESKRIRI